MDAGALAFRGQLRQEIAWGSREPGAGLSPAWEKHCESAPNVDRGFTLESILDKRGLALMMTMSKDAELERVSVLSLLSPGIDTVHDSPVWFKTDSSCRIPSDKSAFV